MISPEYAKSSLMLLDRLETEKPIGQKCTNIIFKKIPCEADQAIIFVFENGFCHKTALKRCSNFEESDFQVFVGQVFKKFELWWEKETPSIWELLNTDIKEIGFIEWIPYLALVFEKNWFALPNPGIPEIESCENIHLNEIN